MRLPFISRRRAAAAVAVATAGIRADLEATQAELADLRADLAKREQPAAVEHTELWSLIDWSLWGSGMGDVFREQLADQFIAAITSEQHAQALRLIDAWTESGRLPLGRRCYEDQQRRLHRALRAVAAERRQAAAYRRTISRLTDQLLDTTGYQGEPLLPAARAVLGIKEDA
ncbi:hypothetical protein [Streptomyces sp. NPDC058872]|uniref:hypothetical protein n=1 Tax=Streptomyces sp. NPDC058872 TaxID=3346661 RepID=UPI0036B1CC99